MPSVRLALGIFVAGSGLLALLGYRGYRSLVDYCADSPEVAAGGNALSCLEPQHWFTVDVGVVVLALLQIALIVVVGAAVLHSRSERRRADDAAAHPE